MEATVVNNTTENNEVEKKVTMITKVRENWKPIAVVAASATVGALIGYKMGYTKGLNVERFTEVVDKLCDVAEDIPNNIEVVEF